MRTITFYTLKCMTHNIYVSWNAAGTKIPGRKTKIRYVLDFEVRRIIYHVVSTKRKPFKYISWWTVSEFSSFGVNPVCMYIGRYTMVYGKNRWRIFLFSLNRVVLYQTELQCKPIIILKSNIVIYISRQESIRNFQDPTICPIHSWKKVGRSSETG